MIRKMVLYLGLLVMLVTMVACSEKSEVPAAKAAPLQVFKQEITLKSPLKELKVDQEAEMSITVKNMGHEPWPEKGSDTKNSNRVGLGYYWIDSTGMQIMEGRTLLPSDLASGASVSLSVRIMAPPEPGNYKLRFSMVQEHVAWFSDKGAEPFVISVKVKK